MRYTILFLLAMLTGQVFITNQKELYLLYSKTDKRVKKFHFASDEYLTFTYDIYFENEKYKTIALDELHPEKRDTVQLRYLSKLSLKDISWLTKIYLEYFSYFRGEDPKVNADGTLRVFDLNQLYKRVFIVIPDSSKGKAVITSVKHNLYFTID